MNDKATDTRPAIFHIDEAVITQYELDPYEGWLYVVILKHANRQTGEAFPGIALLSKLTKMSKRKVSSCITELEKKNLIRVERDMKPMKDEKRQREVNHYFILAVEGNAQGALGVAQDMHHPKAQNASGVMHKVHKNLSSPSSKKKTEREKLLEALTPYVEIAHSILLLIEPGYSDVHKPNEFMTNAHINKYLPHLQELKRLEVTPNELKGIYTHYHPIYEQNGWKIGVITFVEKLPSYRALKVKPAARSTATIIQDTPPTQTPEQRAALLEAMRTERPIWEKPEEAVS